MIEKRVWQTANHLFLPVSWLFFLRINSNENQIQIDYACGWAFPDEDGAYTMQMLLDKADVYMYENKQLCKKRKI